MDALARLAGIHARTRVLDLCAGLGGPARFVASRRGSTVIAVELNAGRATGAARLTRMVGLHAQVRVVRGDAGALPFADGRFEACLSQEALLHIGDKARVLREVHRVLAPGGRLAFSDWIARPALGDGERRRLRDWMAAVTLQTLDGYRALLGRAGFRSVAAEDLSDEWRTIVKARRRMFRAMREDTVARLGEVRYRSLIQGRSATAARVDRAASESWDWSRRGRGSAAGEPSLFEPGSAAAATIRLSGMGPRAEPG